MVEDGESDLNPGPVRAGGDLGNDADNDIDDDDDDDDDKERRQNGREEGTNTSPRLVFALSRF